MTTLEFANLKTLFVRASQVEAMEIIHAMLPRQLEQFADRIELPVLGYSAACKWRFLAQVLAIHLRDALDKIDGPTPCADQFNPDCQRTLCQMAEDEALRHTGAIAYEVRKELEG